MIDRDRRLVRDLEEQVVAALELIGSLLPPEQGAALDRLLEHDAEDPRALYDEYTRCGR
jgi:hypothetical protein